MSIDAFLARVIPTGNFMCVALKSSDRKGVTHFFAPAGQFASAASTAAWCARKGDAYFAVASYRLATPRPADRNGNIRYDGKREQSNVQALKSLWIDLDVARLGDGKAPGSVYPTRGAALDWLITFVAAIGIPRPNCVVDSGYGYHAYWLLEDPMTPGEWQPHADALKAAMLKHGYIGDVGITGDSARLLRPPGTVNMKSGTPVQVTELQQFQAGDYPNHLILDKLQPYRGAVSLSTTVVSTQVQQTTGALVGGNVSSIFGAVPNPNMAAAAQASLPVRRDREFAKIAQRCKQVATSLASNGAGDAYPLWYLGFLSLAAHTVDGDRFVHEISKGDPRYNQAAVDAAWLQVQAEKARKQNGPPRCSHFAARGHQNVCQGCPHFNKILSPWALGVDDGDIPRGYRRNNGVVERYVDTGDKKDAMWVELVPGDIHSPIVDVVDNLYHLTFVYEQAGRPRTVRLSAAAAQDTAAITATVSKQGFTLHRSSAAALGDFAIAWLNELRAQRAERTETVPPFGWVRDSAGKHSGISVGGICYRPDGTEEIVPGGDPKMVGWYRPKGELAPWVAAANLVAGARADMAAIVAIAFAAPLMRLTGENGAIISVWSRQSGVGKSAAFKVVQTCWGSMMGVSQSGDTMLQRQALLANTAFMPSLWDEMQVTKEKVDELVAWIFQVVQGKERGRLNSQAEAREVREWDTIFATASNRSLMDYVVSKTDGTEAGALRVFEWNIEMKMPDSDPNAPRHFAAIEDHYGNAGRVYAKFLAANFDEVDKRIYGWLDLITKDLQASQNERFHRAVMACLMTGAWAAKKLGLVDFDLAGLWAFLREQFLRMRVERERTMIVGRNGYDLHQILAMFCADTAGKRLLTDAFASRGRTAPPRIMHAPPNLAGEVAIHASQADKILRIRRDTFYAWCRNKGLAPTELVHQFTHQWGAVEARKSLAAGLPYSTGQMWCVDIPCTTPLLEPYLGLIPAAQAGRPPLKKAPGTP